MEFIKEKFEDVTDPEPSRRKHEDTEEQIDQMRVKEQRQELNEVEEEHLLNGTRKHTME
ncbi:zinc finger protein 239-like [Pimephales promelas]|nr:zinc finger protein 239-like [Pimephales promelas]